MFRTITDHIINPANDKLTITVVDEPGAGGANHLYAIEGFDTTTNTSDLGDKATRDVVLYFQNGPINEKGVNGITQEVLMAIIIDRLRSFQKGPYACKENACALTHMEEALMWLQQRTVKRMQRGVEGTHKV